MSEFEFSPKDKIDLHEVMLGFETAINVDAPKILDATPVEFSMEGYVPDELPLRAALAEARMSSDYDIAVGDFAGLDTDISYYPDDYPDINSLALKWTTGFELHIKPIAIDRFIAIYQYEGKTIDQETIVDNDPEAMWETLGLSETIVDSTSRGIEDVLTGLTTKYQAIEVSRSRTIPISPQAEMNLRFTSTIRRVDEVTPDHPYPHDVSSEYIIDIDRWNEHALATNTEPTFRNELVFHQGDDLKFRYAGQYDTLLTAGELLDDEQEIARTTHSVIPSIELARQSLEHLAEEIAQS